MNLFNKTFAELLAKWNTMHIQTDKNRGCRIKHNMHKQFIQGPLALSPRAAVLIKFSALSFENLKYRRCGCPFMNIYALFTLIATAPSG